MQNKLKILTGLLIALACCMGCQGKVDTSVKESAEKESTQAYEVTKDSICVHQSINLKEMERTDAHIMILDQPVNFEDSNGNIEDRSISQQVCIM